MTHDHSIAVPIAIFNCDLTAHVAYTITQEETEADAYDEAISLEYEIQLEKLTYLDEPTCEALLVPKWLREIIENHLMSSSTFHETMREQQ